MFNGIVISDCVAFDICLTKEYISKALAAMLDLGSGSGPMDHGFVLDK